MSAVRAKPIEWTHDGNEWGEDRYGFSIELHDDEPTESRYCAAWGEVDGAYFETLEAAQAWCQEQIDDWVRDCALIESEVGPTDVPTMTPRALAKRIERGEEWKLATPQPAIGDVYEAYKTWPKDIQKRLSAHDLRRMSGWAPRTVFDDWAINTQAGGPILTYRGCSVIEGEDARYVLGLISKDATRPSAAVVDDAMVESVGSALYIYWNDVGKQAKGKYREKVRAALTAALTTPRAERDDVLRCTGGCGLPYSEFGLDTHLPDDQWLMVNGNSPNGVMCANCILKRGGELSGVTVAHVMLDTPRADQCKGASGNAECQPRPGGTLCQWCGGTIWRAEQGELP